MRNAKGPILLEIEKVPGVDFGVILTIQKQSFNSLSKNNDSTLILQKRNQIVLIEEIVSASVADR